MEKKKRFKDFNLTSYQEVSYQWVQRQTLTYEKWRNGMILQTSQKICNI